jgi:hypothetical protein
MATRQYKSLYMAVLIQELTMPSATREVCAGASLGSWATSVTNVSLITSNLDLKAAG